MVAVIDTLTMGPGQLTMVAAGVRGLNKLHKEVTAEDEENQIAPIIGFSSGSFSATSQFGGEGGFYGLESSTPTTARPRATGMPATSST